MAEDEEYELLPRHEVELLKKEIERLKKHPFGDLDEGENILDAINNLNNSINKLINIFSKADKDMAEQYAEHNPVQDIKDIRDQNEQIARGIVAVADMIKDMQKHEQTEPRPGPVKPNYPQTRAQPQFKSNMPPHQPEMNPGQPQPNNQPPMPNYSDNQGQDSIPPPPSSLEGAGPPPEMPEPGHSQEPQKNNSRRLFRK